MLVSDSFDTVLAESVAEQGRALQGFAGHDFAHGELLFKKISAGERALTSLELLVKGPMFGCRMCGNCLLQETAFICPMECPKGIRNGPCGGVRLDGHCEVKPEMRCVWVEAWRGSQQMRQGDTIQQVQIPVNHLIKGSSSWLRVVRHEFAAQKSESAQ